MPTFIVKSSEWVQKDDEDTLKSKYIVTQEAIEADRMQVFRDGSLGFMKGRDHNAHDRLVRVFASGEWERAWEETQG